MLRSGLEAICDQQAVKKGSLKSRLDVLASRGVIPPVLAEMTWVLRTLGNEAAHEPQQMSVYTTWALDDFFKTIVEYIYVAPAKLARFKKRLEEAESGSAT
jgi:hypothetical protein